VNRKCNFSKSKSYDIRGQSLKDRGEAGVSPQVPKEGGGARGKAPCREIMRGKVCKGVQ